ncbi:MAG: endonuclease MutS2, partial [Clostridiales bacterium]|nr:endonuclease MutS2 [Clostridiales bacterium]
YMDEKLFKVLEFDEILRRLSEYAISDCAKEEILRTTPQRTFADVQNALTLTDEAYRIKNKYSVSPLSDYDDTTEIVNKAKAGAVLRPAELLKAASVLRCARIAKSEIVPLGEDVQNIKNLVAPLITDRALETEIGNAVAGENELRDDASEKLRDLRRKIHGANAKLKEKLQSYTRNSSISKYLQDNLVTVRMGRFVLPVKSECRSMVQGLIHDQSGSGSTVFIEPFPVVELNNELKYLQMEEQREIERILAVLTERVAQSEEILRFCLKICIMLDIIFAKSAYAESYNGTIPTLTRNGSLLLKNVRHPLIDAKKVVPVTIEVGTSYKIIIDTGPNKGGKTVCLKTTGLCCLMAYSGLPIPCDQSSTLAVYDDLFCDLGDEQSIEQSLSTFSAHIVNVVRITDAVTPNSLVLLDELGAGTDPIEGAALSLGIVKYLELIGCKGVITTHFNELKEYALLSDNLTNACMQLNEETLLPTYKLTIGIPGASSALKIAGTLGVNDYILRHARESLTDEQTRFEAVLCEAQNAKQRAEHELSALEREKESLQEERLALETARKNLEEKREKLQGNAKAEAARLVGGMIEKANELIEELKETIKEGNEEALRKARILRNRLEEMRQDSDDTLSPLYAPLPEKQLKIGQRVAVRSLGSDGEIVGLADKKGLYRVRVGNMQFSLKPEDLAKPLTAEPKQKEVCRQKPTKDTTPSEKEIKLLGMTVAEAIETLEPYLLSSSSGTILRIVHGKGTGALGKGVQAYLKTRKEIVSFRYGRYGEGDTGVTIAELK